MAKYNFDSKKRVVEDYLNGKRGHKTIGKHYKVSKASVYKWVTNYTSNGDEELLRSKK